MAGLWKRLQALVLPPEERGRRGRALRLAGLAVLVAFAAFALADVDVRRVGESLAASNLGAFILAASANVLSLVIHAARWAAVVRPPAVRIRFGDVFASLVAGFTAGVVMPARAGDLVRSHLLARRAGLSTTSILAAAAVDYVIGTAAMVPLLALLGLSTPLPGWARDALLASAVAAGTGVGALFLLRPGPGVTADGDGIMGLFRRFRVGLAAAHQPAALGRCFAWGLLGWGAEMLVAWFALSSVGVSPTLTLAALAVVATSVANVVAVSPGNAGPFELAAMVPLAGLGVGREPALAFALLFHLAHLAPVVAIGGWVLLREARAGRP